MNSPSTGCLLLLQVKRMCSVKYRSWFNQLWTVTMSVYSHMDRQAREKHTPWRGTLRTTINREWFRGPWNKCSGRPRTSKKRAGRWATIIGALSVTFGLPTSLCPEMQAVTKMADLTKFCRTEWMFMDLTILTNFCQIRQSKISFKSARQSRRFWRIFASHVYANYLMRNGPNMLANLTIFMQITLSEMGLTSWQIWRFLCSNLSKNFVRIDTRQIRHFRRILQLFGALLARSYLFTRITLSTTLAKFRQNRRFRPNFHRFTNFAKSVKIVNKISSNLPFSLLPTFLDISHLF